MKTKRVLIFSLVYYPRFIGGAEVAIKEITDRIGADKFEFDMITLRFDRDLPKFERLGNVNIHRIGFTGRVLNIKDTHRFPLFLNKYLMPFLAFFKAWQLERQLKRKNKKEGYKKGYDLIWSMIASYNSFAALFFKILNPKIPFLLTLQEGDPPSEIKKSVRPVWPLYKMIFKKADYVQTISKFLADFAREVGYQGKIAVIPNGVDFNYFTKADPYKVAEIKKDLAKRDDDIWLFSSSRLVKKNGLIYVIRALADLPENIKFIIAGEGPIGEDLELEAMNLGVEKRITFLGHIPHSTLPAYLEASDIFIRPSLSEGFGNSFIEAMASGLPVIATSVGGISDFLKDEETGFVVRPKNSDDIVKTVKKVLKKTEDTEDLIKRAKKMAKESYDWKKIAADMQKMMDGVAS